jgi:hypothetical protein
MNINYTAIMMLYLLPICAMLGVNSYRDIKSMYKGLSEGNYLIIIEKCASPILILSTLLLFFIY